MHVPSSCLLEEITVDTQNPLLETPQWWGTTALSAEGSRSAGLCLCRVAMEVGPAIPLVLFLSLFIPWQ